MLARRGRLLALLLRLDRRAEGRAPCAFEFARHHRYLWPAGAADRARRSDVFGGEAVLCLWARQFDDLPDGGRRCIRVVPRPAYPGCGARDDAALSADDLRRGPDPLRGAVGTERNRKGRRFGPAAALHLGWRAAARAYWPPLARGGRRRHPRRARLDRDA